MATPLQRVIDVIDTLRSDESVFSNVNIPVAHAKLGVLQASIHLEQNYPVTITETPDGAGGTVQVGTVEADLTDKVIYLCGLYSFRNYITQEHHKLTQKAVNFKTINFAVTGLTERAKEFMRIIWWCDNEIERTLNTLIPPYGYVNEMRDSSAVVE